MKGVQCYELFGRVALKNDAFFLLFAVKGMSIKKSMLLEKASVFYFLFSPFPFPFMSTCYI